MNNRIGKIYCHRKLVDEGCIPEAFKELDFTPTHIDKNHAYGVWIYTGFSSLFDELKEGELIPQYPVTITEHRQEDGTRTITATVKRVVT